MKPEPLFLAYSAMKTKTGTLTGAALKSGGARRIRIFLADDSPFMLALLGRVLAKDKRMNVVGSATDGRRAFQLASMSRPDLVLMDIHMAGLDCLETVRWLKQLPNPPIIFMTAWDDSPELKIRSHAAGADAFLVKTEALAVQLQKGVQKFFDDAEEKNESPPSKNQWKAGSSFG